VVTFDCMTSIGVMGATIWYTEIYFKMCFCRAPSQVQMMISSDELEPAGQYRVVTESIFVSVTDEAMVVRWKRVELIFGSKG